MEHLPRLCFLSYPRLREFAMPVVAEYAGRAEIELVDGTFDRALAIARHRIRSGLVDAFVSAGSNAQVLRSGVTAPVAVIQASGFDILQALIRARSLAHRVGVVSYGQTLPELDAVKDLLNIDIAQVAYRTPDEAREKLGHLGRGGFAVIVGSSLVVELAEQAGLHGLLAYSAASIRQGFEDGLELARVARLEAGRYEQLNGVLHTLQDAVLAVDSDHRIIAANAAMAALLGSDVPRLLGRVLPEVAPELSLADTLEQGSEEATAVLRLAQRDWLARRAAIRAQGEVTGAALTLYDPRSIQEADTRLRMQQRRQQRAARHRFDGLIGASTAFAGAVQFARRYARTDLTVLITGESGVGKELFAQAIHNESARAKGPFVAVNCGAFPEGLLESELFGYEEGAFTGSRRGGKQGLFEAAHTGTLFLDEIGDMPLPLQTRLLRVLQEREITRVGATATIPLDVRVIAATHEPMDQLVAQRRFRQDLYYRIHVLRLDLPPLRERGDDILLLTSAFLRRCLERQGASGAMQILAQALTSLASRLVAYSWPGNVRELENVCERIAMDVWPDAVSPAELQSHLPELFSGVRASRTEPEQTTAERAKAALRASGGNHQQAAARLGVSRSTLWRWLRTPEPVAADPQH